MRFSMLPALAAAAIVLTGCGGASSGATKQVQAALNAYLVSIAHHDPAGACRSETTAYWLATRAEVDGQLVPAGRPALPRDCKPGFARLFALHGTRSPSSKVAVAGLTVHGSSASGTVVSGPHRTPTQFVRAPDGHWEIACCTGPQLDRKATATYRVPSGGMLPTLKRGETVTVDNTALKSRPPRLGEIITFHPPTTAEKLPATCPDPSEGQLGGKPCAAAATRDTTALFIKRVVGVPGDRIALIGGKLRRNGQIVNEPFIKPCADPGCNFPRAISVPPGTYYVLGDNRAASSDSRFWGPIRRSWIVGLIHPPPR
jgi:signal peptidase I